jgi:hypothetical protein
VSSSPPRRVDNRDIIHRTCLLPGPVAPIQPAMTIRMLSSGLQLGTCDIRFTVAVVITGVVNRAK